MQPKIVRMRLSFIKQIQMKKVIVILSVFLGTGFAGFSQENPTTSTMKLYKVEPAPAPVVKPELSKEQEIQNCKNMIQAFDTKEAWIRSNPEALAGALENGWFEFAAKRRAELQARIQELEAK